jgi:hypothetical protein
VLGLLSQSQLARLDNPKSFGMMFDASLSMGNKKKEEKKNYFCNFG